MRFFVAARNNFRTTDEQLEPGDSYSHPCLIESTDNNQPPALDGSLSAVLVYSPATYAYFGNASLSMPLTAAGDVKVPWVVGFEAGSSLVPPNVYNFSSPLCIPDIGAFVTERGNTIVRRLPGPGRASSNALWSTSTGGAVNIDAEEVGVTASPDNTVLFVPTLGNPNDGSIGSVIVMTADSGRITDRIKYYSSYPFNSLATSPDYRNTTSGVDPLSPGAPYLVFIPMCYPVISNTRIIDAGACIHSVEARSSASLKRVLWDFRPDPLVPSVYLSTPSIYKNRMYIVFVGSDTSVGQSTSGIGPGGRLFVVDVVSGNFDFAVSLGFKYRPFGLRPWPQSPTIDARGDAYVMFDEKTVRMYRFSTDPVTGFFVIDSPWEWSVATLSPSDPDYWSFFFPTPVLTTDGGLILGGVSLNTSYPNATTASLSDLPREAFHAKAIRIGNAAGPSATPSPSGSSTCSATPTPSLAGPSPPSSPSTSALAAPPVSGISDVSPSSTPSAPRTPRPSVSPFVSCVTLGFTDPALPGVCTNASDPRSANCAYGAGSDCRKCPKGALCPGGFRAWPQQGFYSVSESNYEPMPCAPPAAERCLGWDAVQGQVVCGERFTGLKCLSCSSGYYQDASGSSSSSSSSATSSSSGPSESSRWGDCKPCPSSSIANASMMLVVARNAAIFVGIAVAVALVVVVTAVAVTKVLGGSVMGARQRLLELFLWIVTILQLLAQAGKTAAPGLPPTVASVFKSLDFFQFGGPVITPAECLDSYAFANEVSLMAVALFAYLLLVALVLSAELGWCLLRRSAPSKKGEGYSITGCCSPRVLSYLPWILFNAVTLLYAPASNAAFNLLSCQTVPMTGSHRAALEQDGRTRALAVVADSWEQADALTTASVLSTRPTFMCWSGSHRPAGLLSIVLVAVMIVPLPFWLWLWVRRRAGAMALNDKHAVVEGGELHYDNEDSDSSSASDDEDEAAGAKARVAREPSKALMMLPSPAVSAPAYARLRMLQLQQKKRDSAASSLPSRSSPLGAACWRLAFGERKRVLFFFQRSSPVSKAKVQRPGSVAAGLQLTAVLSTTPSPAVNNPLALSDSASQQTSPSFHVNPLRQSPTTASTAASSSSTSPASSPEASPRSSSSTTLPRALQRAYSSRRQHSKLTLLPLTPRSSAAQAASPSPPASSRAVLPSPTPPTSAPAAGSAVSSLDALVDSSHAVSNDLLLAHFNAKGGFRPSTPFARPADLLLIATLACVQGLWVVDTTLGGSSSALAASVSTAIGAPVAVRAFLICLALFLAAWYYWSRKPFPRGERWKLPVKIGSLLVTALSFILIHVALSDDQSENHLQTVAGLGYTVLIACGVLLVFLAVNFFRAIYQGAVKEKKDMALAAERRRAREERRRQAALSGSSSEHKRKMKKLRSGQLAEVSSAVGLDGDPIIGAARSMSSGTLLVNRRSVAVARASIAPLPTEANRSKMTGAASGSEELTAIQDFTGGSSRKSLPGKRTDEATAIANRKRSASGASSASSSTGLSASSTTLPSAVATEGKPAHRGSGSGGLAATAHSILARVKRLSAGKSNRGFAPRPASRGLAKALKQQSQMQLRLQSQRALTQPSASPSSSTKAAIAAATSGGTASANALLESLSMFTTALRTHQGEGGSTTADLPAEEKEKRAPSR
jgi:hypothetical protein